MITHHSEPADLERGLGSAARLAVENERLQAEALARRDELIESRKRIVEAGDARRRQLERDLHDGAQQSLLAMSYDLQRARMSARQGDGEVTELIDTAQVTAQTFGGVWLDRLKSLNRMVGGSRLRDIADLPLDLLI